MEKLYLPKSLVESGLGPCFDHRDIVYMKFVKDGNVVRVARVDPIEGVVFALYPTDKKDVVEGEAFSRVEDSCPRRLLEKSQIKDKVWLALMGEEDIRTVLSEYPVEMLGVYPSGSYKYSKKHDSRTFHIVETEEPAPQKAG